MLGRKIEDEWVEKSDFQVIFNGIRILQARDRELPLNALINHNLHKITKSTTGRRTIKFAMK